MAAFADSVAASAELRVKMTWRSELELATPAVTQATLRLGEWRNVLRAQVGAASFDEATELLEARVREQLDYSRDTRAVRSWPEPAARARPEPIPVPAERREIVRRKTPSIQYSHPSLAAHVMDVMDYDFHLFIDADSGEDSVVYRIGPTGYRLSRVCGKTRPRDMRSVPLTIDAYPVRELTPFHAMAALNSTELPFMFFRNIATGRGTVLYRRLDGHYGTIGAQYHTRR
jgi:hypothetical protein